MSLDIYLRKPTYHLKVAADFLDDHGFADAAAYLRDAVGETLHEANITHNLGEMAGEAGLYRPLWHPETSGITSAGQLVPLLEQGIAAMKADPARFEKFNSPNGWGLYENFVPWLERLLNACRRHPDAAVVASR